MCSYLAICMISGNQVQEMSSAALGYHRVVNENRKLYNMVQDLRGTKNYPYVTLLIYFNEILLYLEALMINFRKKQKKEMM